MSIIYKKKQDKDKKAIFNVICFLKWNKNSIKDTVALQMLYFLKIKIFISFDSC